MIEVTMLDDIRSFQTKFLGPLTKRQCISVGLAFPVFGVMMYVTFGLFKLSLDTALTISLIPAGAIAACGWLTISNMPMEQFLIKYIYRTMLTPKVRKYKTRLPIKEQIKSAKRKAENEYMSTLSKKELKAYEKKKKAEEQKTIDYGDNKYYC